MDNLDNDLSQNSNDIRERDRERKNRGQRQSRFSDIDPPSKDYQSRERSSERRNCRIYVSNIPYDYRWQDLKDLFRRMVGSVEYVELFQDESGKARGCGIVEFKDPNHVQKALDKMNRHEINGREIVVKEDHGEVRDQYGRIVRDNSNSRGGDRSDRRRNNDQHDDRSTGNHRSYNSNTGNFGNNSVEFDTYNTYGLSTSFLENLGINGPLHNKIFVANLDYKVDKKKLKQIFKLAGKVQNVDLSTDKEGNSRGFAVVEYEHPVEAVQAISMFDRQSLYERRMTVRLDRIPDKGESLKLPDGLSGIGMGLGPNGEPLKNVARNLNSMQQGQLPPLPQQPVQSQNNMISSGMTSNLNQAMSSVIPPSNNLIGGSVSAPTVQPNVLQSLSGTDLATLTNVLGNVKNLTALSNPGLLSTGLSSMGMNLSNDDMPKMSPALSMANNYTTGTNNYTTGANNYSSTGYNTSLQGNNIPRDSQDYNQGSIFDRNNTTAPPSLMSTGTQSNAPQSGRKSDTIVIRNIPLSCTWQTLRDKFRDIGEVKFAEIRGNDVGVVRFFKENDAELAIKLMDGSRMDGRTVSVNFF